MDDYQGEMLTLRPLDDATAELLLAGGAVSKDLEPLAAAVRACRRVADRPVRPSPELAAQMAAGVFIGPAAQTEHFGDAGEPTRGNDRAAPQTAAEPGGRRRHGRRRRRGGTSVRAGRALLGAKIAGMSLAAKALAGLGVATAGVGTAAGFAGVLPDPAQQRFDAVVESVTPYQAKEPPGGGSEFGDEVSEDAKQDGVDGGENSERARQQGEQRRPGEVPAPVPPAPGKPSAPPATPGEGSGENPAPGGPPNDPPGEDRRPPG